MADSPTFTVVVTDYEPSIPRELFLRKMRCLAEQTCDDFEVIVYHDGPKAVPYAVEVAGHPFHARTRFVVTERRANDWGHSNRDRGIREAAGIWIIHTNADNLFYPNLIERLKSAATDSVTTYRFGFLEFSPLMKKVVKRADRYLGTTYRDPRVLEVADKEVIIYAILMRGMFAVSGGSVRIKDRAAEQALLFGGVPVKAGQIDAMQFVMRRDLWLAEGGWHDRSETGDGTMYEDFAKKYAIRVIPEILGEHW